FAGHYHIQSLGSMVPPLLLDPQPGEVVLDMCASPGSKTTQMAVMMQNRGEVWANDVSGVRMNPLAASIDAVGVSNVIMSRFGGERLPNLIDTEFDRILCDVPCTGLGRRRNLAHNYERFVARGGPSNLPHIQYSLAVAAVKMLRPGGRMVYSTCSLSVDENERVIDGLVRRMPVRIVVPPDIVGLTLREGRTRVGTESMHPSLEHARRFVPWENPSEGFFACLLERTDAPMPDRYGRTPGPTVWEQPVAWDHPSVRRAVE